MADYSNENGLPERFFLLMLLLLFWTSQSERANGCVAKPPAGHFHSNNSGLIKDLAVCAAPASVLFGKVATVPSDTRRSYAHCEVFAANL